jgi:DNA-binding GntR family transcriptional regulator
MQATTRRFQRENLSSVVVAYVKEQILSGAYLEGDHVLESDIATHLGISRAPVREGMKELENDGIVTVLPRKGAYITRFSEADMKEVFDIRLLLENNILEILIEDNRLTDHHMDTLDQIVKEMVDIVNGSGSRQEKALVINRKDMEFHRFIWKLSGSERRVQILEGLFFQLRMAMLYDTNETGNLMTTATDHYEILKHLRNRDLNNAKTALKEHIISYKAGRF